MATSSVNSACRLLISIRPVHAQALFAGSKRVELRRVQPRLETGDVVVVYETAPTAAIIGGLVVDRVDSAAPASLWRRHKHHCGLSRREFLDYFNGLDTGYAIVVARVVPLDETIALRELRRASPRFRPPQSYHYLNDSRPSDRRLTVRLSFPERLCAA